MQEVDAVKTTENIALITMLLKKHGNQDFSDIWKIGVNFALRITDLLAIEFSLLEVAIQGTKKEFSIIEIKTGKPRTIRLNKTAIEVIERRRATYPLDVYLFQSHSNRGKKAGKPLTRKSVARKFEEVGSLVDIHLGTHSMRKTRGYMLYSRGVSIEQIARLLNHASPVTTMAYIGITKEDTLKTYDDFEL